MILLVCGGRGYRDRRVAYLWLDRIHRQRGITRIVQGECETGGDKLAREWAASRHVDCSTEYAADWDDVERPGAVVRYRKDGTPYDAAAGGLRNQRMLDEEDVNGVLALPGGPGTRDMVARAKRRGVPVLRIGTDGEIAT